MKAKILVYEKLCPKCNTTKSSKDFCFNSRRPDGLQIYCRSCMKTYVRPASYKRNFGITIEDYNELLKKQGGRCAICKRLPQKNYLAVDHDHNTGRIRGILCPPCNRSVEWMIHHGKTARQYLEVKDES